MSVKSKPSKHPKICAQIKNAKTQMPYLIASFRSIISASIYNNRIHKKNKLVLRIKFMQILFRNVNENKNTEKKKQFSSLASDLTSPSRLNECPGE